MAGAGLGLAALVGGGAIWSATAVQDDLQARARAEVASVGLPVTVTYHGLDAVLTGTVTQPREAAAALGLVAEVRGTRHVTSHLQVANSDPRVAAAEAGTGASASPSASPTATPSGAQARPQLPVGRISFDTGEASLSAEDKAYLDTVAAFLVRNEKLRISVGGHSDGVGMDELNWTLSKERALTTARYLQSRGVAATRMHAMAYAATMPVAANTTPEGRAANRRVELAIEEVP